MDLGHGHEDLRIRQGGHSGRHDEHDLEDRGLGLRDEEPHDEHHDEVHGVQGRVEPRTNTRATQFREGVETTNVKNDEGVIRTNDMKGVGSTHRLHRSRRAKRKYEYKNEDPNMSTDLSVRQA